MENNYLEYYKLALEMCKAGDYLKALLLFDKTEETSPKGRYPHASFMKANILYQVKADYDNALDSLTKAEKDSLGGKYPDASFTKAQLLTNHFEKHKESIESFTKAEKDSLNGKYPVASYCKGLLFKDQLQDYLKAIESFTKAEEDSPEGKFHQASVNKGTIFYENLHDYEKALESFSKAEQDSPVGKKFVASHNKGLIFLHHLKEFKKATESFTKVEEDAPEGKYPDASLNKGTILYTYLGEYKKALESLTKAEDDSPEGKSPRASYNKGLLLANYLEDYHRAIESFTKAEQDSPYGEFPNASYNKGFLFYRYLGEHNKALDSFTKAEEDSLNGKCPEASYNKGIVYFNHSGQYQNAIENFTKAIKDSLIFDDIKKLSYINRSKTWLKLDSYEEAKKDVYTVVHEDSRFEEAIYLLIDNFSNEHTKLIYQNRLEYLAIDLGLKSQQAKYTRSYYGKHTYLRKAKDQEVSEFVFLCLDQRIKFDTSISENDKLRLAYLVAFNNELYANVFYIIDSLIDDKYELTDSDLFFYCASAYLIGEPKGELEYFTNLTPVNENSVFGKAFLDLSSDIKEAIKTNRYLDDYLLDIDLLDFIPRSHFTEQGMHPWINNCLNSIFTNAKYEIPISKKEIEGLFIILVIEISKDLLKSFEDDYSSQWETIQSLIKDKKYSQNLLDKICESIDQGVFYLKIIYVLFIEYSRSNSDKNLHNIAILQAATSTYGKAKTVLIQGGVLNNSKTILSFFAELGIDESFGILASLGLLPKLGVVYSCAKITSLFIDKITDEITLKNQMKKYKAELI